MFPTLVPSVLVQAAAPAGAQAQTGFLKGFAAANDVVTPATKITIAAGICRDDADTVTMTLASGLLKRVDTAWAPGNDAGSLDTGAFGNGWYHTHTIFNPTTMAQDILTSVSLTNPVLPAGFTKFRRVDSFAVIGGAVFPWVQNGDEKRWKTPYQTISSAQDGGAVGRARSVLVPPGIKTEAILLHFITGSSTFLAGLYDPDVNVGIGYQPVTKGHYANIDDIYEMKCFTDVNSQVGSYSSVAAAGGSVISIICKGYVDARGKRV